MAEPLLRGLVGAEAFDAMLADPVLFVRAFDREPFDYQAVALRAVLERDASGKFVKPLACVSWARQQGKSLLGGWAASFSLFMLPDCPQIVSVALDLASAGIILGYARSMILGSDLLLSCVDPAWGLTKSEIRLRDGRRWLIKSSEAALSRGLSPAMTILDELGWAPSSDLFEVLAASQSAQPNPLCLVVSTVGPIPSGPLWSIFEAAERGDPGVRLLYSTENLSPLVSEDYRERQRGLMPESRWLREFKNFWSAGNEAYCTDLEWRNCTSEFDPRRSSDPGPSYMFVDLGFVHDATAIAVARTNPDDVTEIIALETLKGSHESPVQMAAVRARIEDLVVRLGVVHVVVESPQGIGLTQALSVGRCRVDVLFPTALSNRERWGALYTALRAASVHLPPDQLLRRQLLTLSIVESVTGWRVDDLASVHNDLAVAVAGSLFAALEGKKSKWKHIPFAALVGDGVAVVSRGGQLVALVDEDVQAFRALSPERRVRIRQLCLSGTREETLRVQFSINRAVLRMVMDEVGYQLPDPSSLANL